MSTCMPADDEEVRAALAEFTDVTGWFTADRDIHDGFAEIKLRPAQIRRLTAYARLANAIIGVSGGEGDGR